MKAFPANALLWFFILFITTASAEQTLVYWQVQSLDNDKVRVSAQLRAGAHYSSPTDNQWLISPLNVELIAEPGQPVHICAQQLSDTGFAATVTVTAPEGGFIHTLWPETASTPLKLLTPYSCNKYSSARYQVDSVFYSDNPFMIVAAPSSQQQDETSKTKGNNGVSFLPSGLFDKAASLRESYGVSGLGSNTFPPKPPRGRFLMTGSDIALTLLPLMRLDWDWPQVLPMNHWRHWLIGTQDEGSGITLALSINGEPPIYLQLSQEEFRQIAGQATNIRHWLKWLAPKLNGREALIQQLAESTETTTPLSKKTRQVMERQLAALLEWPDHEFTNIYLDFEIHQLQQTLLAESGQGYNHPDQWILQAPKGGSSSSKPKSPGSEDSEVSSEESEEESESESDEPLEQTSDETDDEGGEECEELAGAATGKTKKDKLTITFIGKANVGKSSLPNALLGINHFKAEKTYVRKREKSFKKLPGIVVRSGPGYATDLISFKRFLSQYPISNSEVVVMVLVNDMTWEDKTVLRSLLENGHLPERIIFVRNKFDDALRDSKCESAKDLRETITTKHNIELDKLQKEFNVTSKSFQPIIFTTSSDMASFSEEDDEALVKAIENALSSDEKKTFSENFINLRPKNITKLKEHIGRRYIEAVNRSEWESSEVFINLVKTLNLEFDYLPDGQNNWLDDFNSLFSSQKKGDYFSGQLEKLRYSNASMSGDERGELKNQFVAFYMTHVIGEHCYSLTREQKLAKTDSLGQTPLHLAARAGKLGRALIELELAKKRGKEASLLLNQRDINGRTPLHLAVYSGSKPTVGMLLEYGADPNAKDKVDYTPLHWAAYYGENLVEPLLQYKASLTGNNRSRITPLHIAAWCNQVSVLKKLLKLGADVNSSTYGHLPLHYAASAGSPESLAKLLSHEGVKVNALDDSGYSPLHHAAWAGNKEVVDQLVRQGADQKLLTPDGCTPGDLNSALKLPLSENDHKQQPKDLYPIDIATPLSERGEVRIYRHGYTPLHRAVREGDASEVVELLRQGAQITAKTTLFHFTPLHIAALYGHAEIAELLVHHADKEIEDLLGGTRLDPAKRLLEKRQTNIKEAADLQGDTPLHLAALNGHTQTVKALLTLGANPEASSESGVTVLQCAAAMGTEEMVQSLFDALKQYSCNLNPDSSESFILHIAAKYGNADVMMYLYKATGMDLELSSIDGITPLHVAAKYGQTTIAAILINKGVHPAPQDTNSVTPLFLAAAYNHPEMIMLLGERGKPEKLTKMPGTTTEDFGDIHLLNSKVPLMITPLQCATKAGNLEAAQALVKYCKASPMTYSNSGFTALHFAAKSGHYRIVEWFLEDLKVPASIASTGKMRFTPYSLALEQAHTDVAALLRSYGPEKDIEIKVFGVNLAKMPGWLEVIKDNQIDALERLIEDGSIQVNQEDQPIQPLHAAVSDGQYKCTVLLIEEGADLFARLGGSNDGKTALELAVMGEYPEIIRVLTEAGCKSKDVESSEIPLIVLAVGKESIASLEIVQSTYSTWFRPISKLAVNVVSSSLAKFKSSESEQTRETIKALLAGGSSLEQKKHNNWTPLHLVTIRGDAEFTAFLLSLGAKTETRDRLGRTALHWAAQNSHIDTMDQLVQYGADLEAKNHLGNTPLHRTAANGKVEILKWLLEHNANPNARNNLQQTPLMMVVQPLTAMQKIVLLLRHNAMLNLQDHQGRSGLHHLFLKLPAKEAEAVLHQFSHFITHDLLHLKDKNGRKPNEMIRDMTDFRNYVDALTYPTSRQSELQDAQNRGLLNRIELLKKFR